MKLEFNLNHFTEFGAGIHFIKFEKYMLITVDLLFFNVGIVLGDDTIAG